MLPPPCAYTHETIVANDNATTAASIISLSYLEQWKQKKTNKKHMIVFDAIWWRSPSSTTTNLLWLIACTNNGEIVAWKHRVQKENNDEENDTEKNYQATTTTFDSNEMEWSKTTIDNDYDDDKAKRLQATNTPDIRLQVSFGVLYSMKMVSLPSSPASQQQKTVLIVSGDEGILVLDWSTWWAATNNHMNMDDDDETDSTARAPMSLSPSPPTILAKYQTYPSPHEPYIEINDFDLLLQSQYIIGASGDAFGAYKWNLETQQLVSTFPSALLLLQSHHHHHNHNNHHHRKSYMHSIKTLHCNHHANDDKLVLMGGEGGILSLWDGQQDACIEKWNLINTASSAKGSNTNSNNNNNNSYSSGWIGSIETLSDDAWWIVGGGGGVPCKGASNTASTASTSSSSAVGGFWCTFHGPTRSRITVPSSSLPISSSSSSPTPLHHQHHKNQHYHMSMSPPATFQHYSPQQQYTHAPITKIVASSDSNASWYSVGLEGVVRQWSLSSSIMDSSSSSSSANNSRGGMGRATARYYPSKNSNVVDINDDMTMMSQRPKAAWCDVPCAYAIACSGHVHHNSSLGGDDDDGSLHHTMVAIGGVGSVVNVFKDYNGVLIADHTLTL